MTDTATQPTAGTKRTQKPRDVDYTLEIVDDLPESALQRRSPLEDQIEKIVATPESHGKFVRIGSYANGSAASAAANVLRKRHGDKPTVDGFEVRPVRSDVNGSPRTGLFVKYSPEAIIPGEREQFNQRMQAREDKINERRREREAEKAAGKTAEASSKTKTK